METLIIKRTACAIPVALGALVALSGCISTDSDVLDATEGCTELQDGTIDSVDLDPSAKTFIEASAEVTAAIDRVSDDVLVACANIAQDLGADDSWSELEGIKAQISNDDDTGACDVALLEVDERMTEAASADVDLQVVVAKGECRVPFDSQARCDTECAAETSCEPGGFEARCEPGDISSMCDGECLAGAFCVGSVEVEANCAGKCEAICVGECTGTCHHEDGRVTEADPQCHGRCSAACIGTCSGRCEVDVEAGIACGAGVYCRGDCSGVMESPACVTEFDPPTCEVDTACYESCTARIAVEEAVCAPSSVTVIASAEVSQDLEPLIATLNENLPVLVAAAEAEGRLFSSAGNRMAEAGRDLNERIEDLDGKSLACVGAASTELSDAVDTISVSVDASLEIQTDVDVNVTEQDG